MGHLIPHEKQQLFPDEFRHQFLFGHIGESVIIEIMRAFVPVLGQAFQQFVTSGAVLGGDGIDVLKHAQAFDLLLTCFQFGKALQKVHLVDDRNGRTGFAQGLDHGGLGFGEFPERLEEHQGHVHILDAGRGRLSHAGIQLIARGVDTGGIHQHILHRAFGDHAGDAAAGGLGFLGHDGDLFPHQRIGQAGLAHVGAAHQRHKDAAGLGRIIFVLHSGHFERYLSLLYCRNGR